MARTYIYEQLNRDEGIMFVHGDNIARKEKEFSNDAKRTSFLAKIRKTYEKWKSDNLSLKGPLAASSDNEVDDIINKRVKLLNDYKDFIEAKLTERKDYCLHTKRIQSTQM